MPKGDATWPAMTIDECLAFADEWSRGMTLYPGAQGWRVVCMLLAEAVRELREKVAQLERGEYICKKCGLRKDDEHPGGGFLMAVSRADEAYMNQAAAIRLRAELADSQSKAAELERDLAEQCRLLGMGASREARLMAQLAESQARELRMREAMRLFIKEAESYGEAWARCYVADFDRVAADSKAQRFRLLAVARDRLKSVGESMVEPIDSDSTLRAMIEAAKAEEREAIIAEMPGGHSVDPQWVCDMIRARGDK